MDFFKRLFKKKRKRAPSRARAPKMDSSRDKDTAADGLIPIRVRRGTKKMNHFGSRALTATIILLLIVAYFASGMPDISKLNDFKKVPSVTIVAADGQIIGSAGDVYGDYVPFKLIPTYLIDAVIATEDRKFYHHFGVDPFGLARAMVANARAHHLVQGGSTITQQLAKNVFLTSDRTIKRKIQEMALAFWLEAKFSKKDIITIYLNRVYLGAGNYGIDAASLRYFSKHARQLNLNESAILAGMLKAPSRYAPTSDPGRAQERAEQVLANMVDAHLLTEKEKAKADAKWDKIFAGYQDGGAQGSHYFTDWILEQLPEFIGAVQEDVTVVTTLDPKRQRLAEEAINKIMDEKGEALHASQASLVSMVDDGAVVAMVGGRDYLASQYNRAVQAKRQPGSSFKLFVYLAAIEAGFSPDMVINDTPIRIGKWSPQNYDGQYHGAISLREAVAESINTVAVQVGQAVGFDKVVEMAHRLGINADLLATPSIALGSNEVTLLELTGAYAHLSSNGAIVFPYGIKKIVTDKGEVLFEREGEGAGQALSPNTVAMMNSLLEGVVQHGTGRGAAIARPMAGKTGTTSDYRDALFIGFTPGLTTGVWVGNDNNESMLKVTGGSLPASIWRTYMNDAVAGLPVRGINDNYTVSQVLPWKMPSGTTEAAPEGTLYRVPDYDRPPGPQEMQAPRERPDEIELSPSFWDKLFNTR